MRAQGVVATRTWIHNEGFFFPFPFLPLYFIFMSFLLFFFFPFIVFQDYFSFLLYLVLLFFFSIRVFLSVWDYFPFVLACFFFEIASRACLVVVFPFIWLSLSSSLFISCFGLVLGPTLRTMCIKSVGHLSHISCFSFYLVVSWFVAFQKLQKKYQKPWNFQKHFCFSFSVLLFIIQNTKKSVVFF